MQCFYTLFNMSSEPKYISHLKQTPNGWDFQSNENHINGVAELAEHFAREFGMGAWGKVIGLLHDKGKEQRTFQQHIKRASGYDPSANDSGYEGHAYVGAINAMQLYGKGYANLVVNQIAGHHAGLYDYCALEDQLQKKVAGDVSLLTEKMPLTPPPFRNLETYDFHHLGRMLYSCLVDADFLDTERFMNPDSYNMRDGHTSLKELYPRLEKYLVDLKRGAKDTEVNRIRNEVQKCCIDKSEGERGFYSLTVPTGGGKTLSSLVWAMRHAIKHDLSRIIIAIPYTSIIVQTASILKSIFGEENVLEHHSNVNPDDINNPQLKEQLRLATENWDYPIIVTTNVQLFESMFSNRPSDCRKLHNIVNSVLILDEVQTLPTDFLQPIVDSLKSYSKMFGVSVLFTTASQPILSGLIEGCNPMSKFKGIENITEIIPAELRLHDRLRRVELNVNNDGQAYDEIAEQLAKHDRVLCIVNTRRDAKELFDRLPQEGITIHLSRMMCPDHVSEKITEVKAALKDDGNPVIRVIATQLIEAGVDIDFPVVYRQEAGLDSVLQAAGRCNREGKRDICTTHVFSLSKEHTLPRGSMTFANEARKSLRETCDWFAPETMTDYFRQLYCRTQTFDKKDMKHYLYNPRELMFDTAAEEFRLIDDNSISVIVNWKNSLELIERLKTDGPSYGLMKKLAKYSVNVRQGDFKKLKESGAIEEVIEGIYVISDREQYNENTGLTTENHWLEETIII